MHTDTLSFVCISDRRESTPLGPVVMLDDIDRDYSNQTAQLPEEELLDIYGNEEIATLPAVLSDYVLTQFPPYQVHIYIILY